MCNFKHLLPKFLFIFTPQNFHSSYNANLVDLGTRERDMGELIPPSKQALGKPDMVILVANATKRHIP